MARSQKSLKPNASATVYPMGNHPPTPAGSTPLPHLAHQQGDNNPRLGSLTQGADFQATEVIARGERSRSPTTPKRSQRSTTRALTSGNNW